MALVAWWPFDEGTGTTAVDDQGDNDLSLTDPGWGTAGRLTFNGTSTRGEQNPVDADVNLTTYSFASYVRMSDVTDTNHWFIELTDGDDAALKYLWWNDTNQFGLGNDVLVGGFYTGTVYTDLTVSWTPTINTDYHLAFTWDGTNAKFYVAGVQQGATQTPGTTPNATNTRIHVGRQGVNTATPAFLTGQMWDTRIYSHALTLAEVQSLAGVSGQSIDMWGPRLTVAERPIVAAVPSGMIPPNGGA